ncbi:hypothetical protein A2954_03990 [Candidatus Roizmanbacteria bacterium RIFCSPLOWO2_01_FULL_37_12]|uniref:Uncharacterized protein n=1 Tax=Candidatus Roizmanbacteria bacterium RIFCSPLOWO2_01_FULL_37_12 TaxID=1802056 RepID=A0A1F7IET8_9BACT|nr:MAG: hypothetical protein A3D76_03165 [Candidatus Roizmanbacteria bacterium RIFCSPHIGHO2_02_FULL_37_9b]OGK41844.1 MAG: hypothetical protein A2954_03990 [Candidatus Roizmanbacteria bacterium RIFCSPLOWO2_01_FULL_37_12]
MHKKNRPSVISNPSTLLRTKKSLKDGLKKTAVPPCFIPTYFPLRQQISIGYSFPDLIGI